MKRASRPSAKVDPRDFFERVLPGAITRQPDAFLSAHGRIAFAVLGKGAWTVRLGDCDAPIAAAFDPEAELKLRFVPGAFAHFANGTLDVADAIARQRLQVAGDADLLDKLSTVLGGGGSAIGARMSFKGRGRF